MQIRASDFRPIEGSAQRDTDEPYGFFDFDPAERLDLDLVDRLLVAARDEVDSIDVVCLPESAIAGRSGPLEGFGTDWFHVRQNKHHRWSLDAGQIYQCHLGGELHPAMRWWEA